MRADREADQRLQQRGYDVHGVSVIKSIGGTLNNLLNAFTPKVIQSAPARLFVALKELVASQALPQSMLDRYAAAAHRFSKTHSPYNHALDTFTYIHVASTPGGEYKAKKTLTHLVGQTYQLVCAHLLDDSHFPGSEADPSARTDRLISHVNTVVFMDAGICNFGKHKELLMTLNGIHQDVQIIPDIETHMMKLVREWYPMYLMSLDAEAQFALIKHIHNIQVQTEEEEDEFADNNKPPEAMQAALEAHLREKMTAVGYDIDDDTGENVKAIADKAIKECHWIVFRPLLPGLEQEMKSLWLLDNHAGVKKSAVRTQILTMYNQVLACKTLSELKNTSLVQFVDLLNPYMTLEKWVLDNQDHPAWLTANPYRARILENQAALLSAICHFSSDSNFIIRESDFETFLRSVQDYLENYDKITQYFLLHAKLQNEAMSPEDKHILQKEMVLAPASVEMTETWSVCLSGLRKEDYAPYHLHRALLHVIKHEHRPKEWPDHLLQLLEQALQMITHKAVPVPDGFSHEMLYPASLIAQLTYLLHFAKAIKSDLNPPPLPMGRYAYFPYRSLELPSTVMTKHIETYSLPDLCQLYGAQLSDSLRPVVLETIIAKITNKEELIESINLMPEADHHAKCAIAKMHWKLSDDSETLYHLFSVVPESVDLLLNHMIDTISDFPEFSLFLDPPFYFYLCKRFTVLSEDKSKLLDTLLKALFYKMTWTPDTFSLICDHVVGFLSTDLAKDRSLGFFVSDGMKLLQTFIGKLLESNHVDGSTLPLFLEKISVTHQYDTAVLAVMQNKIMDGHQLSLVLTVLIKSDVKQAHAGQRLMIAKLCSRKVTNTADLKSVYDALMKDGTQRAFARCMLVDELDINKFVMCLQAETCDMQKFNDASLHAGVIRTLDDLILVLNTFSYDSNKVAYIEFILRQPVVSDVLKAAPLALHRVLDTVRSDSVGFASETARLRERLAASLGLVDVPSPLALDGSTMEVTCPTDSLPTASVAESTCSLFSVRRRSERPPSPRGEKRRTPERKSPGSQDD